MTASPDGSPMQSAFEAERVEWLPSGPELLEVRVAGRWRGGVVPAAVELVVDDHDGGRRGFAAAESDADALGLWRARFPVPVELRSRLGARLALRAGEAEHALPAALPGAPDGFAAPPPATVVEPAVLEELRARREGAADEGLVRRAQAAEATAATLETQLDHLEARLRGALADRDRLSARLRTAEQREESERRVRVEAEDERDTARADGERRLAELRGRVRAAEDHAAALAAEMDGIRREGAEALHAAATARAAAERALAAAAPSGAASPAAGAASREADAASPALVERMAELEAIAETARAELREASAELDARGRELAATRAELERARTELVARPTAAAAPASFGAQVEALEHEVGARIEAERRAFEERTTAIEALIGDVRGRLASAGGALEAQLAEARRRADEALADRDRLAVELAGLRAELERERIARAALERELAAARGTVPPPAPAPASVAGTDLEATRHALAAAQEQLAAERARSEEASALREHAAQLVADLESAAGRLKLDPAPEPEAADEGDVRQSMHPVDAPIGTRLDAAPSELPVRTVPLRGRRPTPWLAPALASLAADDLDAALELFLALLPAQGGLVRSPFAYRVTIEGEGTYRVEVGGPHGGEDVDAHLTGPLAALAPLVAGGAARGLPGVTVEGRKRKLRRLVRARRAPLDIGQLAAWRMPLPPRPLLAALAAAAEPAWSEASFAVAYAIGDDAPVVVEARPGERPRIADVPPSATITLPDPLALLALLARTDSLPGPAASLTGDPAAAATLHAWFDRAQGLPAPAA